MALASPDYPKCETLHTPLLLTRLAKPLAAAGAAAPTAQCDSRIDGSTIAQAPLPEVLEDSTGKLAPVPVIDVAVLHASAFPSTQAASAPFVVRGFAPATRLARHESWQDGEALCKTHPRLCAFEGSTWSWSGWQQQYHDTTGAVDEQQVALYAQKYGVGTATRDSFKTPLSSFVAMAAESDPAEVAAGRDPAEVAAGSDPTEASEGEAQGRAI